MIDIVIILFVFISLIMCDLMYGRELDKDITMDLDYYKSKFNTRFLDKEYK